VKITLITHDFGALSQYVVESADGRILFETQVFAADDTLATAEAVGDCRDFIDSVSSR
jgi:hypothetical protein